MYLFVAYEFKSLLLYVWIPRILDILTALLGSLLKITDFQKLIIETSFDKNGSTIKLFIGNGVWWICTVYCT